MRIGSSIVLKGSGGEGGLGLGPGAPEPVPDPRSKASVAILDQPCMYLSACMSTSAQRKGSCAILWAVIMDEDARGGWFCLGCIGCGKGHG